MSAREDSWLRTDEFADLAEITHQAARKALRRAATGQPWRGRSLVVRPRFGQGGRSGRQWEVARNSLPEVFQASPAPIEEAELEAPLGSRQRLIAGDQTGVIGVRWAAICKATHHPSRSPERAAALAAAAHAAGRSERTLHRWISQYETHGLRGLGRARNVPVGTARVLVSRRFDTACRAAGYGEDVVRDVAVSVQKALKGLWASRAEQAGGREIRSLAEFLLMETCEARGMALPKSAMQLSRRGVERFAHYRVVNQRRNDRKAFDDAKPRIRRDWTGLVPMERIVADVKHLDVIVTRPDGSPAWPKIVGFMDAGTGRIFVHPVLLERGEGVRQEHVIEGFLAMVSDPKWGFPQGLYLDNGSEFSALAKIDRALQLINEPGARTVIFARPYNASAKPIESLFARLDRYVFSMMPGYAGPNRMAKKTQTVGRPPRPYPGSWEDFCGALQGLIGAHHNRPVGGQWGGRSPNEWFNEKVAAGWRPARVEPLALDAAFSDHDSRRIDRGVLSVKGERFSHPALAALASRTVVDIALPWRRGAAPLAKIPLVGWVYLEREVVYPARWIEGARESRRRQQTQSRYVSALARDAPRLDPVATKIRWSQRAMENRDVRVGSKLDLGCQLDELATAARENRRVLADAPTKAELRRARDRKLTERLEGKQTRDR